MNIRVALSSTLERTHSVHPTTLKIAKKTRRAGSFRKISSGRIAAADPRVTLLAASERVSPQSACAGLATLTRKSREVPASPRKFRKIQRTPLPLRRPQWSVSSLYVAVPETPRIGASGIIDLDRTPESLESTRTATLQRSLSTPVEAPTLALRVAAVDFGHSWNCPITA